MPAAAILLLLVILLLIQFLLLIFILILIDFDKANTALPSNEDTDSNQSQYQHHQRPRLRHRGDGAGRSRRRKRRGARILEHAQQGTDTSPRGNEARIPDAASRGGRFDTWQAGVPGTADQFKNSETSCPRGRGVASVTASLCRRLDVPTRTCRLR